MKRQSVVFALFLSSSLLLPMKDNNVAGEGIVAKVAPVGIAAVLAGLTGWKFGQRNAAEKDIELKDISVLKNQITSQNAQIWDLRAKLRSAETNSVMHEMTADLHYHRSKKCNTILKEKKFCDAKGCYYIALAQHPVILTEFEKSLLEEEESKKI